MAGDSLAIDLLTHSIKSYSCSVLNRGKIQYRESVLAGIYILKGSTSKTKRLQRVGWVSILARQETE